MNSASCKTLETRSYKLVHNCGATHAVVQLGKLWFELLATGGATCLAATEKAERIRACFDQGASATCFQRSPHIWMFDLLLIIPSVTVSSGNLDTQTKDFNTEGIPKPSIAALSEGHPSSMTTISHLRRFM